MKNIISLAAASIGLSVTLPCYGQGTFTYDQQSANESFVGDGILAIQTYQPMGQSFTPSLSSVGFVRLVLYDANPGNGLGATVYLNLRSNSITGPIVASTDPVFMPDSFGDTNAHGFVNFFFSTPPLVTPGTNYFLQPVVQSGDTWLANIGYAQYSYVGGIAYLNGQPEPNREFWFREGVVTPEPSSTMLLLLGGSLLAYSFRRSRNPDPSPQACETKAVS